MAQYKTGTVNVTQGQALVTGNGTNFTAAGIASNNWFVGPDGVIYTIAGGVTAGQFNLSAPYQGNSQNAQPYAIHKDFHPNGQPLMEKGDLEPEMIFNAFAKTALPPNGWGSAAARNVMASFTDITTPDALMPRGAFGVGPTKPAITDLNEAPAGYSVCGAADNLPTTVTFTGGVSVFTFYSTGFSSNSFQRVTGRQLSTNKLRIFERQYIASSWSGWVEIITDADLIASPTDTATGKVLTVGYAGIGRVPSGTPPVVDANSLAVTGFFQVSDTWVGSVFAGTNGQNQGYLTSEVWGPNSTYRKQTFFNVNSAWVKATRRMDNGVWTDWVFDYNQRNILGTVSQSGGVPTGALIQRGSNANGEFVRFADGTQICSYSDPTIHSVNTSYGALWRSASLPNYTFPVGFIDVPLIIPVATAVGTTGNWAATVTPASTTQTGQLILVGEGITNTAKLSYTAIGRWY